jgi:hypothetical protein
MLENFSAIETLLFLSVIHTIVATASIGFIFLIVRGDQEHQKIRDQKKNK